MELAASLSALAVECGVILLVRAPETLYCRELLRHLTTPRSPKHVERKLRQSNQNCNGFGIVKPRARLHIDDTDVSERRTKRDIWDVTMIVSPKVA